MFARRRRLMLTLLLPPLLIYLGLVAFLYFAQTAMLFPVGQVARGGPLPEGAEPLELRTASGERLLGFHVPPARRRSERLLILGFGGNAAGASGTALDLHALFPDADIVVFHYRGYAPSEGSPSAAAFREDALRIHDFARARFRPDRMIAVGFSVGSGVAASLSAERDLDGLILVTPFDSLRRVASDQYWWAPVRLLFRHELEPVRDLRRNPTPVAILAGGRDDLVPGPRTQALRLAAPILAFDRTITDAGHNDIYDHPDFADAMRGALRRLRAMPRRAR